MTLYLIRHAHAEQDTAFLSEVGQRQAYHLAQQMCDKRFDMIISSDLPHAQQTAKYLRDMHPGTPFETWPELREIDFAHISKITPEQLAKLKRARQAWNKLQDFERKHAIVVTDRNLIAFFLILAYGEQAQEFLEQEIEHAQVIVVPDKEQ